MSLLSGGSHLGEKDWFLDELLTVTCINVLFTPSPPTEEMVSPVIFFWCCQSSWYIIWVSVLFLFLFSYKKAGGEIAERKVGVGRGSEAFLCRGSFRGLFFFSSEVIFRCCCALWGSSCHWSVTLKSSAFSRQVICRHGERTIERVRERWRRKARVRERGRRKERERNSRDH
jgi:hypothetical protein